MLRAAFAGFAAACAAVPAMAAPAPYDIEFVSQFAEACVPQRLSYPGTLETARQAGWTDVERSANPELDAMMAISEAAALDPELQATFQYQILAKSFADTEHFLVVSRSSFVIDPEEDPVDPWILIGCYIYNLDATAPIDPEPVTALIGKPISNSISDETLTAHVWGPPCPMPRTGDTYLTFVPEGSPQAEATGFSGLVLKFSTSEPDPGEVVPETYC
jgi:hypothetical protein